MDETSHIMANLINCPRYVEGNDTELATRALFAITNSLFYEVAGFAAYTTMFGEYSPSMCKKFV